MRKILVASIAALVVISIGAAAIEWEEIDWGSDVVLDSSTGLPAIVFYATIEYSESPNSNDVEGGWEAYEIVNGQQVPLNISPVSAFLRGETLRIYTATSQIPIETGRSYGAKLTLVDTINNLSYQRTFNYSPVELLPYGISLRGWDGSDDVDLSALPDEELEELAVLYNLLRGYTQSPDEQTVEAFLRGDAAAKPDTAILLDGALGEEQEIDRCTYSACGAGCCSTCVEHEETNEPQEAEDSDEPTADVRIECIVYEGIPFEEDGNEYVQIKNYGDLGQDLLGWTLTNSNDSQHAFTFSESFVLEPQMSIRVYTNEIYADTNEFSFGLEESLWTNVTTYPVSLVLIPVPPNISSSGSAITFTVTLTLYTYTLESPNDISYVLSELRQFQQDFDGSVYVGSGSSIPGGGKTIFVHELVWRVLEAASIEIRNR